jgi:hypothetical protein
VRIPNADLSFSFFQPGQPSQVTVAQAAQPPEAMWTPVQDPKTGQTYYWNQSTGETTAVGEPM